MLIVWWYSIIVALQITFEQSNRLHFSIIAALQVTLRIIQQATPYSFMTLIMSQLQ